MVIAGLRGVVDAANLSGIDLAILDHQRLEYGQKPTYLRLVNSLSRALDYARGGFHVAVVRGQAGGCSSPAGSTPAPRGGTCAAPMNSPAASEAWANAAKAYFDVAQAVQAPGARVESIKSQLAVANVIADQAYGIERVPPPRDPGPSPDATTEPTYTEMSSGPGWGGLVLAAGFGALVGVVSIAAKKHIARRAYA
jgi:hypothetical protein